MTNTYTCRYICYQIGGGSFFFCCCAAGEVLSVMKTWYTLHNLWLETLNDKHTHMHINGGWIESLQSPHAVLLFGIHIMFAIKSSSLSTAINTESIGSSKWMERCTGTLTQTEWQYCVFAKVPLPDWYESYIVHMLEKKKHSTALIHITQRHVCMSYSFQFQPWNSKLNLLQCLQLSNRF